MEIDIANEEEPLVSEIKTQDLRAVPRDPLKSLVFIAVTS